MYLDIAKFTGYGLPKNANAFFIADVTDVKGAPKVALEVVTEPVETI